MAANRTGEPSRVHKRNRGRPSAASFLIRRKRSTSFVERLQGRRNRGTTSPKSPVPEQSDGRNGHRAGPKVISIDVAFERGCVNIEEIARIDLWRNEVRGCLSWHKKQARPQRHKSRDASDWISKRQVWRIRKGRDVREKQITASRIRNGKIDHRDRQTASP
jgi:hypothetical protein